MIENTLINLLKSFSREEINGKYLPIALENNVNFRTTINLQTLPFSKNGMYRAIVEAKASTRWKEVANLPYFLYEVDNLEDFQKQQT